MPERHWRREGEQVHEIESMDEWRGRDVIAPDGQKIGKLDDLLYDKESGGITLLLVKTGRLSAHRRVVPLMGASFSREYVRVAFSADQVAASPELSEDGLRRKDEVAIAHAYGLAAPESSASDDDLRYETADDVEQRRAASAAALARADELEEAAAGKAQDASTHASQAAGAKEQAEAETAEHHRLMQEAARLRAQAGGTSN
jgi:sporulation protein YlmC with PRC-barrel domain